MTSLCCLHDPVLYSGSLRYNLDPFGRSSDEDLWSALHLVSMKLLDAGFYSSVVRIAHLLG